MGFVISAQVLLIFLFGACFCSYNFSLSEKAARAVKISLIAAAAAGVLMCIVSLVSFFSLLSSSEANETQRAVITDSYVLFLLCDSIFIIAGLLVTFLSSLLKSALRPVIPLLLPMWALLSLFWTLICSAWSEFSAFDASLFVILYGIGAAAVLSVSALPQMSERAKALADREKRGEIIRKRNERRSRLQAKRQRRKALAEKKKRLKHPGK